MAAPASVIELINGSGNNFHAKVASWFSDKKWHTVVSPYYMDQSQAKAREIDLVVEKTWCFMDPFKGIQGHVVVRLFVECKFVANEAVFWLAPKDIQSSKNLVCNLGPFRKFHTETNEHHYVATSPKVAKLFASSNSNAKAQENEPFYKALNQVLNATVALRSQPPSHPDLLDFKGGKQVTLNYPVVVCSSFDKLYSVDFLKGSEPEEIQDAFQLEVRYAFHERSGTQRNEYFLVDFVAFDQLAQFEDLIGQGAESAKNRVLLD